VQMDGHKHGPTTRAARFSPTLLHYANWSSSALYILQDRSVQAFGEPAVDRREKITGFGDLWYPV